MTTLHTSTGTPPDPEPGGAPARRLVPSGPPRPPARARASRPARPLSVLRDRLSRDEGMATAEYAIATVAAAGFAGLLITVLRSDEVRGLLVGIVRGALSV